MPLYEVTPPRPFEDAVAGLVPADATYTLPLLLDAMWAVPRFGHPGDWLDGIPKPVITGMRQDWTYSGAERIVQHSLGIDAAERLRHAMVYLSGAEHNEDYLTDIALLLRSGWTRDDGMLWSFAGAASPEIMRGLPVDLAARWVAAWSLSSLNACVRVGMDHTRLEAVLDSGTLPPADAIEALIALRD